MLPWSLLCLQRWQPNQTRRVEELERGTCDIYIMHNRCAIFAPDGTYQQSDDKSNRCGIEPGRVRLIRERWCLSEEDVCRKGRYGARSATD